MEKSSRFVIEYPPPPPLPPSAGGSLIIFLLLDCLQSVSLSFLFSNNIFWLEKIDNEHRPGHHIKLGQEWREGLGRRS